MISCGWIISHRCSWITVYALCYLPLWADTSSELWTRSIRLHLYYHLLQALFTFRKHYFISLQANISFHTIHLILCLQQTGEIDNLTVSCGKVVWLCCVQVPCCCWHRHRAQYCFWAPLTLLWRRCQSQLATTFRSGFFLLLVD
jgi:hypothetical protein